jgi:hypothetical protein
MPIQTIEKQIDGHSIQIVQFVPTTGFKIKARLLRLVLPALGSLFGPDSGTLTKKDIQGLLDSDIDVAKAATALAGSLDDEDALLKLLLDLLSTTKIDNHDFVTQKIFNEVFVADYMLAYKVAWEVVKANNFFAIPNIGGLSLASEKGKAS